MQKLNPEIAELVGIIMGDGHIHYGKKKYFGITGSPKNDKEYYNFIKDLIYNQWGEKGIN